MPRARADAYGRPLPTVAPATRQDLSQSPQNQLMRRYVLCLLEEGYRHLYRRGCWAEVTVRLQVKDGTVQSDVTVEVRQPHRHQPDEE
jgi:hypothetical protein